MIALFDFDCIMNNFKFLRTVIGKGFFNLFVASMFLVGNGDSPWGYIMMGSLAACGIFYILVGCACINRYDDKDLKKNEIKAIGDSEIGSQ